MAEDTKQPSGSDEGHAKLPVEDILANARVLTGYSKHIAAGALRDQANPITAATAKRKVEQFAQREIA
jgi:hypothetical protein